MSYEFVPWEQDGPLPTFEAAVEVDTKTEVGVIATAYDVRPGRSSFDVGCGVEGGDGCVPENSRDGIASEIESRWSCATKLVEGGGPCQIEYTFAEPQDIVDIMVSFWKGNERIRTLDVRNRLSTGRGLSCPQGGNISSLHDSPVVLGNAVGSGDPPGTSPAPTHRFELNVGNNNTKGTFEPRGDL